MCGLQSGQRHALTGPSVCFAKQDEVIVLKIAQGLGQSSLPHPLGTFTQDFGILAWVLGFLGGPTSGWCVRVHSPPSHPALLRMIPFREGLFSHFPSCRFPALVSATLSLCGWMCRSFLSWTEVTLKKSSLAWHRAKCFSSVLGL